MNSPVFSVMASQRTSPYFPTLVKLCDTGSRGVCGCATVPTGRLENSFANTIVALPQLGPPTPRSCICLAWARIESPWTVKVQELPC
ncbi:hypothetical protein MSIMFI_05420 [Mycobacterium simulans]|nr:hypothetical protein MSIMFI_05420 [Mycobacterium simulans]